MNLKDLLAISGKPGLYRTIGQNKNSLIVESLEDGKKLPVYSAHKISALEDISIYTYDADVPLSEVFQNIFDKENGGTAISHKSAGEELKAYMGEVLPEFDEDRVYTSDIKKIFNWYNQLHKHDLLSTSENTEETDASSEPKAEENTSEKEAPASDENTETEA